MAIFVFTDIKAWQKAHELTLKVYKTTESFPREEVYCLTSQIRRCAISVPSNIAEGFKRKTKNDSMHFYTIALSSLEELKYQLILAQDLGYISKELFTEVSILADEVGKLTFGWTRVQK
ncbi:MAG: four helix bundle protein [bacterium]|nr:four helix bundle protein [bacterium]